MCDSHTAPLLRGFLLGREAKQGAGHVARLVVDLEVLFGLAAGSGRTLRFLGLLLGNKDGLWTEVSQNCVRTALRVQ